MYKPQTIDMLSRNYSNYILLLYGNVEKKRRHEEVTIVQNANDETGTARVLNVR